MRRADGSAGPATCPQCRGTGWNIAGLLLGESQVDLASDDDNCCPRCGGFGEVKTASAPAIRKEALDVAR
jgi:hypothetical protein